MPCNRPLQGYRSKKPTENGKYGITFNFNEAQTDEKIDVPCGQCLGCRADVANEWELRMLHEQKCHDESSFITLTYDMENLPFDGGLSKEHWTAFMKALRKRVSIKIRFVMGAEYGEERLQSSIPWLINDGDRLLGRPHFHAIIYGYDFPDKQPISESKGNILYESELLQKCWPYGFSSIGEANNTTARYTLKYIYKQLRGDSKTQYKRIHPETGEEYPIEPEFRRSSRMPGIGAPWVKKYYSDLFKGYCTIDGKKYVIPDYYMDLLEKMANENNDFTRELEEIKANRLDYIPSNWDEMYEQFNAQNRNEGFRAHMNAKVRKDT
ncbi:replication initiator protein [Microviridae sp.]|nr:replication initiator protein [Microviridae sp.]